MTSAPIVSTKIERGTGRPSEGYFLPNGERVPSVTTILGQCKDPGPLVRWSYKVGLSQGFRHSAEGTPPAGLYNERAAEIGSAVHHAAECFVLDGADPFDALETWQDAKAGFGWADLTEEQREKARTSTRGFVGWWTMAQPEVIAAEVPLVSPTMKVGGTPDLIAYMGGQLMVLDWKTSKAVYAEMKVQLAAYAAMWGELRGEEPTAAAILRFDKHDGGFTHEQVNDLARWREAWGHAVGWYRAIKG